MQFIKVLYCKLLTNGKQLPAFPLQAVTGIEPRPQRWDHSATVAPTFAISAENYGALFWGVFDKGTIPCECLFVFCCYIFLGLCFCDASVLVANALVSSRLITGLLELTF